MFVVNRKFFYFFLIFFNFFCCLDEKKAKVTIIGAGPAGITVVGLLLDLGVLPEDIVWIDPLFNVGRLGEFYSNVPGNAKNKIYVDFMKSCNSFQKVKTNSMNKLFNSDPEDFGVLSIVIEPLQDITNFFRTFIFSIEDNVKSLDFYDKSWKIKTKEFFIDSENVIFATGSKPKILDYEVECVIPLDYALDKEILCKMVKPVDKIAVVGGSHSAILILKFLSETSVKKIINFYKNPITYAVDMGTWTENSVNGLKGITALWAKEVLEKNPPKNLIRIKNTEENLKKYLPECNKIIYAIGYEMNSLPITTVEGKEFFIKHDPDHGIIGPNLFGIGIAFPGNLENSNGEIEQGIGLSVFMKYAQKVMVNWIKRDEGLKKEFILRRERLNRFNELFFIEVF